MSALIIQELTGSQRSLTLRGRALPERGPEFGGRLRNKTTWYSGTNVATMQVFGGEVTETEFEGMWSDRHLDSESIVASGFGDNVTTAMQLVQAMESIRDSGNALRVSWGPFVRNGVLAEFMPRPEREVDVAWKATFDWYSKDDQDVPIATTDEPPDTAELREAQNTSDDQQAFAPSSLRTDYVDLVQSRAAAVRGRVGDVFDRVRAAQGQSFVPLQSITELVADVEALRDEANAFTTDLVETFLEELTDFEELFATFNIEAWRRTQARRVSTVRARAQTTARELRAVGRPEPIRIVETKDGDTLRRIAAAVYGTADEWQRIATANDLPDSEVASGTLLVIPPLGSPIDTRGC